MALFLLRRLPLRPCLMAIGVLLVALFAANAIGASPALAAPADRTLTDGEVFPDGFVVPPGETWAFDPGSSVTIEVSGSVEVYGRLEMKPSSPASVHSLVFEGVDESAFVGAQGHQHSDPPVETDIGLWVLGAGVLDIQGAPKKAWDYAYQDGWSGDEVVAAPVAPGVYAAFPKVTSTPPANKLGYQPELLNLTRNVIIRGTPAGKTHVMIQSSEKQTIKYATIRYVAPDLGDGDLRVGTDKTGRYGLHFHKNGTGSVGSVVEGVVIRDADNHAFVPHASHGIRFKDTIAFNTVAEAYWWDESTDEICAGVKGCNASHDIIYDGAVAALTHGSPYGPVTSAAFSLGEGERNTIVGSVAVGMQGDGQNTAGFKWPSAEDGVWTFENNIAHNNDANGIFVWQNTGNTHVVNGFEAYHNAKVGIDHGAYANAYVYQNLTLLDNVQGAIDSHAHGKAPSDGRTDTQRWEAVDTGARGILVPRPHAEPNVDPPPPVRFVHCDFAQVVFDEIGNGTKATADAGYYDFIECGLDPGDFDLGEAAAKSIIRVQDGTDAFQLTGTGVRTDIPTFFTVDPPLPPPPGVEAPTFVDTSGSVFAADIEWLAESGITKGCNPPVNDLFCPEDHVTRGQMAAFLDRALDLPAPVSRDPFEDDDGSVFEENIESLARAGITKGCNPPANDRFCPEDHITRGQMAAFLVRAFSLEGGEDRFGDDGTSIFEADINALAESGITLGCNPPANDRFCPDDKVTRGQMAAFLHRASAYLP